MPLLHCVQQGAVMWRSPSQRRPRKMLLQRLALSIWNWLQWFHISVIGEAVRWWEDSVLGTWEEWVMSLIRQGFEEGTRFLHAVSSWFLSVLNYRSAFRESWERNPWQQWWHQVQNRDGTLNAFIAAEAEKRAAAEAAAAAAAAAANAGESDGFHGELWPPISSSQQAQTAAQTHPSSSYTRWSLPRSLSNSLQTVTSAFGGGWATLRRQSSSSASALLSRQDSSAAQRATQRRDPFTTAARKPVKFELPAGLDFHDADRPRGLLEDFKMAVELRVARMFGAGRHLLRTVFFLPQRDAAGAGPALGAERPAGAAATSRPPVLISSKGMGRAQSGLSRSHSLTGARAMDAQRPAGASRVRRVHSFSAVEDIQRGPGASMAAGVIRMAGYPVELHTVTTPDGYILRMERIPRPGARDVVFFMHGILDTSLAWVTAGVTASQAFAAWDNGFDVWLGNSRSNAPRMHIDPAKRGIRYWQYNVNHMGLFDVGAQVDHIHATKVAERMGPRATLATVNSGSTTGSASGTGMRHSSSAPRDSRVRSGSFDNDELRVPSGPCCVDSDGEEPLPRHSSSGVTSADDEFSSIMIDTSDTATSASAARNMSAPHLGAVLRNGALTRSAVAATTIALDDNERLHNSKAGREAVKSLLQSVAVAAAHAGGETLLGAVERHTPPSSLRKSQDGLLGTSVGHASSVTSTSSMPPAAARELSSSPRGMCASRVRSSGSGRTNGSAHPTLLAASSNHQDHSMLRHHSGRAGSSSMAPSGGSSSEEPYRLRAVGHSLGGMALFIYIVSRLKEGRPHHLSRMILLTPAGFHSTLPKMGLVFVYGLPPLFWLARHLIWNFAFPFYIPTFMARAVMFKLVVDISRNPSLGQLLKIAMRTAMGGDASDWDRAMQMPHYNAHDMPGISAELLLHMVQISKTGKFRMFDYGRRRNLREYGQRTPPDVAEDYRLIDIPVDLVAGEQDGVIPPANIRMHYSKLRAAGVKCSYREFNFGHLDFTFAVKEDLKMYILRLLKRT